MKTLCFTGHRPNKLKGYNPEDNSELLYAIRNKVEDFIINKGVSIFINGGALGVDIWSALIVLRLKKKYPHITLIIAIPCKEHSSKWTPDSVKMYEDVLSRSDRNVIITNEDYNPGLMQVRNEWMVDKSDYVLGIWDGTKGGTNNCLQYARSQEKIIEVINPNNLGG